MTNTRQLVKSLSLWLVIGVLGIFSIFFIVKAASSLQGLNIENCNDCQFTVEGGEEVAGMLGASGTRFPNGVSADSTSPSAGELRGTTLTITGNSALTGTLTVTGRLNPSGLLTTGSSVLSTTTAGTATTLSQANLLAYDFYSVTPDKAADMTYTLPATSTLSSWLANTGDKTDLYFNNTTSTAGTEVILAAGAGWIIDNVTSTLNVYPGNTAKLSCVKVANTDVHCLFNAD